MSLNVGLKLDLELIANAHDSAAALNFREWEYQVVTDVATDVPDLASQTYSADGVYLRYVAADLHNGVGYFLQHDDAPALDIDPVGWAGMVEAKFHTKQPNVALNQILVQKGTIAGDDEWGLLYSPNTNKAIFFLTTNAGADYTYVYADMPTDPTLVRHFFFFGVDVDTGKAWLQVDDGTPVSAVYGGAISSFVDAPLWLGAARGGNPGQPDYVAGATCDADLRHFRLWGGSCISFTGLDRTALYNSGAGVTFADIITAGAVVSCGAAVAGGSNIIDDLVFITDDRWVARLDETATSDLMVAAAVGLPIPDWAYSTGFALEASEYHVGSMYLDVDGGVVEVGLRKDMLGPDRALQAFHVGQAQKPMSSLTRAYAWRVRLTGRNEVAVRRLAWEREGLSGKGA